MTIYSLGDKKPTLPDEGNYWIAPGAHVMGQVELGKDVGIWFGSVLRGDNDVIKRLEDARLRWQQRVDNAKEESAGIEVAIGFLKEVPVELADEREYIVKLRRFVNGGSLYV